MILIDQFDQIKKVKRTETVQLGASSVGGIASSKQRVRRG